jgi:hypothetical protein
MAAPDFSTVSALSHKATELCEKGYYARAAEKFGDAVDAALALPQASPDCLVVATLRVRRAVVLQGHVKSPATLPADALAASNEAIRLHIIVAEAVERRWHAGTLLKGCCRPWEVAWAAAYHAHWAALQQPPVTEEQMRCVRSRAQLSALQRMHAILTRDCTALRNTLLCTCTAVPISARLSMWGMSCCCGAQAAA